MAGTEEQSLHSNDTPNEIFKKLDFRGTKRFKQVPESCNMCGSVEVIGIELIGAKEGVLYWECSLCREKYLKYTKVTTMKYLKIASELWIDLGGLENICEEIPN